MGFFDKIDNDLGSNIIKKVLTEYLQSGPSARWCCWLGERIERPSRW